MNFYAMMTLLVITGILSCSWTWLYSGKFQRKSFFQFTLNPIYKRIKWINEQKFNRAINYLFKDAIDDLKKEIRSMNKMVLILNIIQFVNIICLTTIHFAILKKYPQEELQVVFVYYEFFDVFLLISIIAFAVFSIWLFKNLFKMKRIEAWTKNLKFTRYELSFDKEYIANDEDLSNKGFSFYRGKFYLMANKYQWMVIPYFEKVKGGGGKIRISSANLKRLFGDDQEKAKKYSYLFFWGSHLKDTKLYNKDFEIIYQDFMNQFPM
ncbi:hypothetical protein [Mycoplasmopsis gallinacea]|uniref:Uncharacterized protein n=1 Tax=Mycoplasmopsis gallinacea TaxID=29556 RepID=A0A6H0V4J9_9BACT|nr:hypothetical protein [Mycoplasmopsis gallinacea]QIW61947.1 hypothetical protein GOQ20_00465 [Mycoplasmopsis gallinacea]